MNEIITRAAAPSILLDAARFENAQRAGKMMALSALFPAHLRSGGNEAAIANAVLVMNIADRMHEDPLAVAQNIYFIGGKPGWNASYMISRANQSGVFRGPIRWRTESEGKDLVVYAFAKMADDGETVEAEASMAMARAEGWTRNAKYSSMPKQMLQYRAATFLIRLYCPQVMLGYQTADEIEDVVAAHAKDINPPSTEPEPATEPEPEVKADGNRVAAQKKFKDEQKARAKESSAKAKAQKPKGEDKPKPDPNAEDAVVIDDETGEVTQAAPEPETDPGAADGEGESFDRSKLPEESEGAFDQIVEAINTSSNGDEVDQTLETFSEVLAYLTDAYEPAAHEIDRLAEEKKASFE